MKQASSSQRRVVGWTLAVAFAPAFAISAAHAQGGTPPAPAPSGLASIKGFLIDSVHNTSLSKALVVIEGANRSGATDADGHFRIDSIPPGPHRVTVLHPLLDTLGVLMRTPALDFTGGQVRDLDLSIPSPERLADLLNGSSIFLCASRNEGWGLPVTEAMAWTAWRPDW